MKNENLSKNSYHRLIIDASPLLTILTIRFAEKVLKNEHQRVSLINRVQPNGFALRTSFHQLFESVHTIVTSSYVIAELQGLISSRLDLKGQLFEEFLLEMKLFLESKNLDERLVFFDEILKNEFSLAKDIGWVDTSLIVLAKKIDLPILTKDRRTLGAKTAQQGIQSIILDDEVYQF